MTDKERLQIGWDCDGVGFDFKGIFIDLVTLNRHHRLTNPSVQSVAMKNSAKFKFYEDAGLTSQDFLSMIDLFVEADGFAENSIVPGFKDAIENSWEYGDPVLCTAREYPHQTLELRKKIFGDTHNWVQKQKLAFRSVIISKNKTISELDMILEDSAESCHNFLRTGTMLPVLFTQPWNADDPYPVRVDTHQEYVEIAREASQFDKPFWEYIEPRIQDTFNELRNLTDV